MTEQKTGMAYLMGRKGGGPSPGTFPPAPVAIVDHQTCNDLSVTDARV